MSRYHTVIWDWNGTLLDDVELALGIVNKIFEDHGVTPLSLERYQNIFDFPVKDYYRKAGMDFSKVSFETLSDRFNSEFQARVNTVKLFAPVPQLLAHIQSSGRRQYVLSGTEHHVLDRMLEAFAVRTFFDGIKGLNDGLAHGKITAGAEMMKAHALKPAGSVMVGDTEHDFEVADALGLDCVLLTTGHHSARRLLDLGCPVFDSLEVLEQFLLQN